MAIEERVQITVSERGVAQTDRKIKKLGRTAKTTAKAVGAIAIAIGAVVAVRGLARLAGDAVQASAAFEGYRVQLKALLGTQEDANKALDTFVKLSSSTPFGVAQIAQGATVLAAAANGSRQELEELVKISTNIAGVTGLTFTQTAENLARALNSGIGAADLFREKGVRKLIEDNSELGDATKATAQELRDAFESVFAEQGKFGNAAKELSLTLGGSLSNIEDAATNFKAALGDAFSPVIINTANKLLIPFFNKLQELVTNNEGAITRFAANAVSALIQAFVLATKAGLNLTSGFAEVRKFVITLTGSLFEAELQVKEFNVALVRALDFFGLAAKEGEQSLAAQNRQLELARAKAQAVADDVGAANRKTDEFTQGLKALKKTLDELQTSTATANLAESIPTPKDLPKPKAKVTDPEKDAKALAAQVDARKDLIALAEQQIIAGIAEDDRITKRLFDIDKQIAAAVELGRVSGEEALAQQVINDLIQQRVALLAEGQAASEAAQVFSENVADGLKIGVAGAIQGGGVGAFGDALEAQAQQSLLEGINKSIEGMEEGLSKAFDKVADSLSETFGPAFDGVGEAAGAAVSAALQFAAAQILSAITGSGKGSSSSSTANLSSAVTSTEAVRGIVAGPQSIAIATISDDLASAVAPVVENGNVANVLLSQIASGVRGISLTSVGDPSADELAFQPPSA